MKLLLLITLLFSSLYATGTYEEINIETTDNDNIETFNNSVSLEELLSIKLNSGSFLDLKLKETPYSVTIITKEQIKLSGAGNMSELLEIYVPGFQYMYNKWNGIVWGLRGVANDRNTKIIYLINGHSLNSQSRDGFNSETSLGLMDDIEKIEVLRGAAGLVYGSGSISGVVNVITKKNDENISNITALYGTNSNSKVQINLFSKYSTTQNFSFSFGAFKSDGIGNGKARLYGLHSWPYPGINESTNFDDLETRGVNSDGSFGSTTGNYLASTTYNYKNFSLYLRTTKQVFTTGGLFIYDPHPNFVGSVFGLEGYETTINGEKVTSNNSFWSSTESWGENRKEYTVDNILLDVSYKYKMKENEITFRLSHDLMTNRVSTEVNPRYNDNILHEIKESFGEKRVTFNTIFLLNSVENLKMAMGSEIRLDFFGDDLDGLNQKGDHYLTPIIYDTTYTNLSLFSEGDYSFNNLFSTQMGIRIDKHTHALMVNGKIASIFKINNDNIIKLAFQTASNNGSVDNYEYNKYHYDMDGKVTSKPSFLWPYREPTKTADIIVAPRSEIMHQLKPERVKTIELTSQHTLFNSIDISPSLSYGVVNDLFGWSQELYRVVNTGSYQYINMDLDTKVDINNFTFGAMHTFQKPVNTLVNDQKQEFIIDHVEKSDSSDWYTSVETKNGTYYTPIATSKDTIEVNIVKTSITEDGENFLNLSTHVSKFYADYKINSMITWHTDLRVFWGLRGRENIYKYESMKYNFQYWDIWEKSIKKLNTSLHFDITNGWIISVYANNILAIENAIDGWKQNDVIADISGSVINTIRWQQRGTGDQKGLYSTDQRNFELKITKNFN